ncbi:MAG: hypothetical protein H7239_00920 [Flavobacterium sp.]|nr:hypothetical protein [Flavobacterium sp.]
MKKNLVFVFFVFIGFVSSLQAQPISIKTSSVSFTERTDKNNWTKWSDFVKAEILITIDGKKNRIVVNSPEIQVFTIKSYGDKTETDTDKIIPFDCIDNNGSKCKIFVITRKKEANRMQFYINYSDVKFVYNIYN